MQRRRTRHPSAGSSTRLPADRASRASHPPTAHAAAPRSPPPPPPPAPERRADIQPEPPTPAHCLQKALFTHAAEPLGYLLVYLLPRYTGIVHRGDAIERRGGRRAAEAVHMAGERSMLVMGVQLTDAGAFHDRSTKP